MSGRPPYTWEELRAMLSPRAPSLAAPTGGLRPLPSLRRGDWLALLLGWLDVARTRRLTEGEVLLLGQVLRQFELAVIAESLQGLDLGGEP